MDCGSPRMICGGPTITHGATNLTLTVAWLTVAVLGVLAEGGSKRTHGWQCSQWGQLAVQGCIPRITSPGHFSQWDMVETLTKEAS